MNKLLSLLIGLIVLATATAQAAEWPITYELTGALSGDYTTTGFSLPFTNALFTLRVTADTRDVVAVTTFDPASPNDLYVVGAHPFHTGPSLLGVLDIAGVGSFSFSNNLYASDSQTTNQRPGNFEIGTDYEATFLEVQDTFFETYHLATAVNPLTVALWQTGAATFAVSDSGGATGELSLTGAFSPMTFQAEGGVPEPSTFVLLGAGLVGMIVVKRKSRGK